MLIMHITRLKFLTLHRIFGRYKFACSFNFISKQSNQIKKQLIIFFVFLVKTAKNTLVRKKSLVFLKQFFSFIFASLLMSLILGFLHLKKAWEETLHFFSLE